MTAVLLVLAAVTLPLRPPPTLPAAPSVKLYIVPKVPPLREGDEIIKDPRGFFQKWKYQHPPEDPSLYSKDPFTWA